MSSSIFSMFRQGPIFELTKFWRLQHGPWVLLIAGVLWASSQYGIVFLQRKNTALSERIDSIAATLDAQQYGEKLAQRQRLFMAEMRNSKFGPEYFLSRKIQYRSARLSVDEINLILDQVIKGGSDSISIISDFRLVAEGTTPHIWGSSQLHSDQKLELTLFGEQYFRR